MWQTDSDLHFDDLSDSINDAYSTKSVEKRLLDLIHDRDQWRHKYELLLSAHQRQEHNLASELQSLEGEVKTLSSRIYDLTTEKKAFVDSTNELLLQNSRLQAALEEQQTRLSEDIESLQTALERERKACAREISTIATQFAEVKTKFQRYKAQMESGPSELREENLELKKTVGKLQEELRHMYMQMRTKSPMRETSSERPRHSRKSSKRSFNDVI